MTDDLNWRVRRWVEADEHGRDDEADAACRALFAEALREPPVAPDFAARTAMAVAAATARDARVAHRVRRATLAGSLVATAAVLYAGGPWMLSGLSALLVGGIDLLVGVTVRLATGMDAGGDIWTLLGGLGRAAAAFVANPTVTFAVLAMQGIAMAALIVLQRLLGPDRESFK